MKLPRIAPVQLYQATDKRRPGDLFNTQTGRVLQQPLECEVLRAWCVRVRRQDKSCRTDYHATVQYRGRRYSVVFKGGRMTLGATLLALMDYPKRVELYTQSFNIRAYGDCWMLMARPADLRAAMRARHMLRIW